MGFELNRRGFDPEDVQRDGLGRVALVTGANSGIGRAASLDLLRRGFDVWMLCRDLGRGSEARDAMARECGEGRVHLAVVDISSLRSIRRLAEALPLEQVDVLVHNAGVLPRDKQLTEDGVELTFATNVLGPFALTGLLMDRLARSSDARVIFVASGGLYLQRFDLSLIEVPASRFHGPRVYANAKRGQVILAGMLAERFSDDAPVTFASMHPGWVDTTALRTSLPGFYGVMRPILRTAEQGADTVVWLATSDVPRGTRGQLWFDRRVACQHPLPWTRERGETRKRLLAQCELLSHVSLSEPHRKAA
jgi:NAD(P)-dependent dehydrogenase (short-subunit alcohol dehydrogenase family)